MIPQVLMVIVGLLVLKAIVFPRRERAPQVLYVVHEPARQSSGNGCLPMIIFLGVVVVAIAGIF
jgi:uncharacterized metal-binding protein